MMRKMPLQLRRLGNAIAVSVLVGLAPELAAQQSPATSAVLPECADGIDNDKDGLIDYPEDAECDAATDDSEDAAAPISSLASRWLLAIATSGSLNGNTCAGEFTGGDGSVECPGVDVHCSTCTSTRCGNAAADDSRLYTVKVGLSNLISLRDETKAQFALIRAHQTAVPLICPAANISSPSGGWQGAPTTACEDGYEAGDLLVSFSGDGATDMLAYLNLQSDSGAPLPGIDFELRATGERPLAGILASAMDALVAARTSDPAAANRHYGLVLLSDGASTCPGDAVALASSLEQQGFQTHVIGISVLEPDAISELNAIAAAGGTGSSVFLSESADICQALATVLNDGIPCDSIFRSGFE